MKEVNRSIDAYKKTNYDKPYERDHFLYDKIKGLLKPGTKLLDIGCGDSRFLYYLRKRHPDVELWGLEFSRELIEQAKSALSGVKLVEGDARSFDLKQKFDVVIMAGVHSIFDDVETPIRTMERHIKDGGVGIIFGMFCSKDIDVLVKFRNNYKKSKDWEGGLNMFSLATMRKVIRSKEIDIQRFELPIDIAESEDPIRSYTIKDENGKRIIVSGANIIHEFYSIKFKK